jgi:hypothetical protein
MATVVVTLTEENRQKLELLSSRTGKTPDELLNQAFEQFASQDTMKIGHSSKKDWQAGWRQAMGMWKDRTDIAELISQIRREWDRS